MKKLAIFVAAAIFSTFQFPISTCAAQDAVYKLLKHEWTVNADGTSDYHYRHEIQILRNRALTAYADKGETFVVYNPDLESLTINEVYTLRANGSRVDMPQNAFVHQLPSECADCGRFNHFRELAMVHTGMELGCTIVVDYTIHRQYNLLNETLQLPRECPIEHLQVNVQVPQGQELSAQLNDPKLLNIDIKSSYSPTSYSLTAYDVPQTFVDSYLPPASQLYPILHFFNGTPNFVAAEDNTPASVVNNAIKTAASVALSHANGEEDGDRDVVRAVHNLVLDNIHYNDIHPSHLGYVHSTPAQVWLSGCGTATDKAVLAAAILNELGYMARVIGDDYDEVGVRLDTMEYRLSMRYHSGLELIGEAKDEVVVSTMTGSKTVNLIPMEDGFYRLQLPAMSGEPAIKAANMAITRTAPLMGQACDLQCNITIPLPKGVKMVENKIVKKLAYEGVGTLEISIRQSGSKLKVVRNLKLDKSIITPSEYAAYRQLIATWQTTNEVLLRQ